MVMLSIAIIAGLVLLPLVLMLVLRAHGAIAFMSLCLGSVLVTYAAPDMTDFLTEFTNFGELLTEQWVQLGLLTLPLVFALIFTSKTVAGNKQMLNFVPALATGLLLALLVMPLLPSDLQHEIERYDAWQTLANLRTAVLLGGAFFSMMFLLMTSRPSKHEEKHKK